MVLDFSGSSVLRRLLPSSRRSIPNPCHHFPNRRFWTASEALKKQHLLDRALLLQSRAIGTKEPLDVNDCVAVRLHLGH
jgi:hypothetical protein